MGRINNDAAFFMSYVRRDDRRQAALLPAAIEDYVAADPPVRVQKPSVACTADWHSCTVIIHRRSISGRLVWGTILRRWDGRRWIYKNYIQEDQLSSVAE